MKKLIVVASVAIAVCGCEEKPANYYGGGVWVREIEGHRYITNGRGGIYHAESCSCKHAKGSEANHEAH